MLDEGYIKFKAHWTKKAVFPAEETAKLHQARQILYQHKLIGAYDNGIGFGNISQRFLPMNTVKNSINNKNKFLITGSATGNYETLNSSHFSLVTKVNISQNSLFCEGPIVASSESMSHAVIYHTCPEVGAVVHVHSLALWQQLLWKIPTTDADAAYGTPEMANSIVDLLKNTDLRHSKLFVMSGHEEGIFSFGANLEEAVKIVIDL